MREGKFETQINIRVREATKQDLKEIGDQLDLETTQAARIALNEGIRVIRARGLQTRSSDDIAG